METSLAENQDADLNALRALVDQWKQKREVSNHRWRLAGVFLAGALGLLLFLILYPPFWILILLFYLTDVLIKSLTSENARHSILPLMDRIDDLRAIGLLCEAQELTSGDMQKRVISALLRLLPRLQADRSALLNRSQRICLYRSMDYATFERQTDFVIAIVEMWERIGDIGAVPHLQRLRNYPAQSPAQEDVHKIVDRCLATLKPLYDDTVAGQTLLRGAASPAEPPNTLLRPANEVSSIPSEQLLRATNNDS